MIIQGIIRICNAGFLDIVISTRFHTVWASTMLASYTVYLKEWCSLK